MKNKTIQAMLVVFGLLIIVGTFFDQQIAIASYGKAHAFAKFFEIFGEFPFFLGLISAIVYFFTLADFSKTSGKIYKILNLVLGIFFSVAYGLILISYARSEFGGGSNAAVGGVDYAIAAVLGLIIFSAIAYGFSKIQRDKLRSYRQVAWLMIALVVVELIGVQAIKNIWGRPRFWSVNNGDTSFVPWYVISGPAESNMFKSFISGHTANAFMMIFLYVIPSPDNQQLRNKLLTFGLVWGSMTGLSRVLLGQHYLTDVTFGGVFTILAFFTLKKLLKVK